ncbi:EAL domain-containing protein [Vibrio sp. RE86]|uniref:EAL domain-containing response regulator n=1 Tax=Vibrio sp. RE86 TaxID=2607605 RepID=UPI001493BA78|nr:EAL domain-containing protein [Vibrio sp. RE86]NOH81002.1 EAL domain-containing protein [Vibrio sp. RE86]
MNKSVLIVDDVELSREILSNAVSSIDMKLSIVFAENAYEAMSKMKNQSFDLIIMDIMMPDGDGFELLSMLSKNESQAKIVITSGLDKSIVSSVSMLGKLYDLNIVASLEKPIWTEQMSQLVESILQQETNVPKPSIPTMAPLDGDDFPIELVYQSQVISDIDVVCGFEVLSRWSDENGSLLPPSYFLPMVENLGKQKRFTEIVISKFVQDYKNYFGQLDQSVRFSLNIDPNLLVDQSIVDQLVAIYEQGVEHTIVIEITEQGLVSSIERELLASCLKLRLQGFELSIDDFGIESSNIERVMKLPVNEIKIDKSITWSFEHNTDYKQVIEEANKLASVKNARVLFEGVENDEMCKALEKIGGHHQQGFFHSVPVRPESIKGVVYQRTMDKLA